MNSERYQKICDIFDEAEKLAPEKRGAFLSECCGGDEELKSEVESLLASSEESGDFIQTPAFEVAAKILADEQMSDKVGLEIGHYKMVSLLGAGGMGEVWLAEDARLKRHVALKLLSTVHQSDLLRRFEQEAHAISALNHPNIITIFDIGQSDNWQFIATEHINGKTLRQLIREESLTIAKAFEIAIQICVALAAAHSAGIIHRDIKPENVMVRADGIVKVLDFGLARFNLPAAAGGNEKLVTKPGIIMGTVAYMSPEQARGANVEDRTDIFSLGIVLYETLTGKMPFDGANEIETLAAILEREPQELSDNFPDSVKEIITRALSKNYQERPTAEEMLEKLRAISRELESSPPPVKTDTADNLQGLPTIQRTAITGNNRQSPTGQKNAVTLIKPTSQASSLKIAALAGILLVAVLGFAGYRYWAKNHQPAVLTNSDKLLIADFENKTGDEELEGIFRQPLAVGLAQSPFISLIPDGQIRQTLKQMEKSPGEPLTNDIAREICLRRSAKAFLKGTIENYGVKYLIRLEAFNAQTGESVAREETESANKDTILDSLNEATGRMREKLGESLASIKQFDVPLKTSTTSSLEALKTYTLATKSFSDGNIEEAITLYKQAANIDPNYAGAYASLAAAYSNKGQKSVAADYAAKAFALRDRMTEREKQKITDFYYVFVTGETDKDIEILEAASRLFPRDETIQLNLGASYCELGKFAKAEESARQTTKINPAIFFPYSNLGKYLSRQSRFEEAKAVYEDAINRKFESTQINSGLFTQAFAMGNEAEMQQQLKILEEKDQTQALMLKGNALIFSGAAREYEKLMTQAVDKSEKDEPDAAADYAAQIAVNLAALGKCDSAKNWANKALKLDSGQQILTDAALTRALCGEKIEPLLADIKQRFPKNTAVNNIWLPIIIAASGMNESPEKALESLETNRQFEGAAYFWDNYLRGKIYRRLKNDNAAVTEFFKILQNRGWATQSPLFALANLELAQIYKAKNDSENAGKYSAQFNKLWKIADPDLPVLKEFAAVK